MEDQSTASWRSLDPDTVIPLVTGRSLKVSTSNQMMEAK